MKRFSNYMLLCLFTFGIFTSCKQKAEQTTEPDTLIKTTFGAVSGSIDDDIFAFKGIPYAKADRFMPPQDPDSWEGVRETTEFGPVAKQVVAWIDEANMDEKNLFNLNVWTPSTKDGKKRPVMVWFHGGGFHIGSSNDPMTYGKALAKKGDVVIVSVNHRLNILGFLDLSAYDEKYKQSANAGILDAVKALEWVKNNIENFGGDSSNVTIFGESGGGGKVGTLMCMPSAKGLFHKAIIQSGTLINVMTKEKSQALGKTVLENLGVTAENLNQLDTISYQRLVKAGNDAILSISGPRQPGAKTMFGFAPSADGETLLQQPFSPGFADISNDIPLLMGTTLNELINTAYGEKDLTLEQAKERLTKTYGNKTNQFVELYEKAYPNFTPQDLLSIDTVFRPFTIRTLDSRAAQSNAPLYAYFLAWKSGVDDASKGSFHGLDIPLAFNTVDLRPDWTGNTPEAWELAETMSSAWLNFAKTGNPNVPERLPEWPIYTAETGATMYFDDESKVLNNHDRELMELVSSVD